MVVNDFNFCRTGFRPGEANAPLVVDPDAVLSGAVALRQFKTVARWGSEVGQYLGIVQLTQLALRNTLNIGPYPTGEVAMKQGLGIPICQRMNQSYGAQYARVAL